VTTCFSLLIIKSAASSALLQGDYVSSVFA
jgi:hypothetical protein